MSKTESTMLPLGTSAPEFSLPAYDGTIYRLDKFRGAPALLVMFMCNHCPYVKHVREGLVQLTSDYIEKGVAVIGINSNDADTYPDDGVEQMRADAEQMQSSLPTVFSI